MSTQLEALKEEALLRKAQFILNPQDLLTTRFGIVFALENKKQLERYASAVDLSNNSKVEQARQALLAHQVIEHETLELCKLDYTHTLQSVQQLQNQKATIEKKLRLAKSAARSIASQNAWMNKEHAKQTIRSSSIEKEILDLNKAIHRKQVEQETLSKQLQQEQQNLPQLEEKKEEALYRLSRMQEEVETLASSMHVSDQIFRREYYNDARRMLNAQHIQVDQKQLELAHIKSRVLKTHARINQLEQQLSDVEASLKQLKQSLANSQARYEQLMRGMQSGKGMLADEDARLVDLNQRIREQEQQLQKLEEEYQKAVQVQVAKAQKLVELFVHTKMYHQAIEECKAASRDLFSYLCFAYEMIAICGTVALDYWESAQVSPEYIIESTTTSMQAQYRLSLDAIETVS